FGLTPAMMCLIGIPSCPSGHSWAAIRLIASWVGDPLCCRLSLVRRTRGAAGAAASTKAAGQIFASAGFHTRSNNKILEPIRLKHHPHRFYIVRRPAPVAMYRNIAEL